MRGLVLAGGKGSRMGREKGGMVHPDGRTMVRRAVDLLSEAGCERVVLALREGQGFSEYLDVELVRDTGEGALVGIIAGMETAADEDWLVVACDLPRLEVCVLKGLLGFSEDFVAYGKGGILEATLCILWKRSARAFETIQGFRGVGSAKNPTGKWRESLGTGGPKSAGECEYSGRLGAHF